MPIKKRKYPSTIDLFIDCCRTEATLKKLEQIKGSRELILNYLEGTNQIAVIYADLKIGNIMGGSFEWVKEFITNKRFTVKAYLKTTKPTKDFRCMFYVEIKLEIKDNIKELEKE